MGDVFLELKQHEVRIGDIIAAEEASFGKTLVKVSLRNFVVITLCLRNQWPIIVV